MADLYSDRATIHVQIQGQAQGYLFTGRALKAWRTDLVSQGKAHFDGSVFHAARVERRGNRLIVRARRYSSSFCYWDDEYRATLAVEAGQERIIDEHLMLQPSSRCASLLSAREASDVGDDPSPGLRMPMPVPPAPPSWQPMSRDDIAAMALKIARETAAKSPASASTAAQLPILNSPATPAPPLPVPSALRVNPSASE